MSDLTVELHDDAVATLTVAEEEDTPIDLLADFGHIGLAALMSLGRAEPNEPDADNSVEFGQLHVDGVTVHAGDTEVDEHTAATWLAAGIRHAITAAVEQHTDDND